MATVYFYEKPGCISNGRQKKLLAAAGHDVVALDLLKEAWTPERLRPYFGDAPVPHWFNRSAPAVKNGEVTPEGLDETRALALMVAHPLLIRRPLMRVAERCMAGFDPALVDAWIGLGTGPAGDVEGCPRERAGAAPECGP